MEDIKETITERLFALPEEIKKFKKKDIKLTKQVTVTSNELKIIENDMWIDIYNDSTLTNEKKRNTEFVDKKLCHTEHISISDYLAGIMSKKRDLEVELETLADEQRNLRALCYMDHNNNIAS